MKKSDMSERLDKREKNWQRESHPFFHVKMARSFAKEIGLWKPMGRK